MRHILDLPLNLISAGKLDEEGYDMHYVEGCWILTNGSLAAAGGTKCCTFSDT